MKSDKSGMCEHLKPMIEYFEHLCCDDADWLRMLTENLNQERILDMFYDMAHEPDVSPRIGAIVCWSALVRAATIKAKRQRSH